MKLSLHVNGKLVTRERSKWSCSSSLINAALWRVADLPRMAGRLR